MGIFKKISNINSNKLTSVLALLISLGTFSLLFYEIKLTREQQYVSVLPYLSISQSIPSTGNYKLYVVNDGIGPAFIEEVRFKYNGKIYKGDGYHVYKEFYKDKSKNDAIYSSGFKSGNMLPPGSSSNIIGTSSNEETVNRIRDLFMNNDMIIEIIYASVYGEKWIFNNREGVKKIDD
ncbi:hypothetical protein [Xanthomarina gelatinilytica]|uniref:hypothetical protein n=1 Tax=Xanthomarina gelatinilytica TaxID=1137281 RepID=UPI003AA85C69